jgi:hypothetical protein
MDCDRSNCLCTSEVGIHREGRTYCSDHCAESARGAAGGPDRECRCGHAGCASEASGTALG